MSSRVIGLAINAHMPERICFEYDGKAVRVLGSTAKLVLIVMAGNCKDDGTDTCQSISTIQDRTSLSRPTVISAIRALASLRIVSHAGINHRYHTANYEINVAELARLAAPIEETGKATLPEDSKASLPPSKATLPSGKTTGKATLPESINLIPEEEEEEESSQKNPEPQNAEPTAPTRPEIFSVYEQNIGPLTPLIAESLADAADVHTSAWVAQAINEAVKSGVRNWRYVAAILQRWQREGYGSDSRSDSRKPSAARQKSKPTQRPGDGRIRTEADFQRAADAFLNGGD